MSTGRVRPNGEAVQRVDASRLNKAALILGIVATILVFVLVLRLLDVTGSQDTPVALETVEAGTAQATAAAAAAAISPTAGLASGQTSAVANAYPNVHSSIGVTSPIVGTLSRGESAAVIGRSADGVWLEIRYPKASSGLGWVSADLMVISPTAAAIPVATPP